MRYLAFLLLLLPLSVAASDIMDGLQSIRDSSYHRLDSGITKRPYHLIVKSPQDQRRSEKYPTIYVLDGGALFPMLSGYSNYLRFQGVIPDMVIVGISYGSDSFEGGNYRSTDFTAPSTERDFWGGASAFHRVLTTEIVPLIEDKYPSDPNKRILFGQSIGGQFALYSALNTDSFWGHIASNPALHRNLDFFLQPPGTQNTDRLFVAVSTEEDPYRDPAMKWIEHWQGKNKLSFQLKTVVVPDHGHFSIVPESFRQGLIWLLAENP